MKNYERNPFSVSFGKKPTNYIERILQTDELLSDLRQDEPSSSAYMITGVRGSGKTVFMTSAAKELERDGWIIVDLNPKVDMRKSLVSSLYTQPLMNSHFLKAKIDLSLFNIGVAVEEAQPLSDYDVALDRMMKIIRDRKKRVLVTIDEVTNSEEMQIFVGSFQILIRRNYPICLLMTGLYENIYDLQNEPNLTFLYRAPKIYLQPLNIGIMKQHYMESLGVSSDEAGEMARLVKGYPYGFQVLGYLFYKEKPRSYKDILPQFDQYMSEYVYEKIWSEMSEKDREVLKAAQSCPTGKVKEIRAQLNMQPSSFSVYRERLMRKGAISAEERGIVRLALPRFKEFMEYHMEL